MKALIRITFDRYILISPEALYEMKDADFLKRDRYNGPYLPLDPSKTDEEISIRLVPDNFLADQKVEDVKDPAA